MSENKVRGAVIVKLVVWIVVLAILCPIFVFAMESDFLNGIINGNQFTFIGGNYYENADSYNIGEKEYSDKINDININWVSGNVQVLVYDGDTVKIEEENEGSDRDDWMRSKVENGKLLIKYAKSGIQFFHSSPIKNLKVYLPLDVAADMGYVKIDVVSANLQLSDINAKTVDINTVSGNIKLSDSKVGNLEIDCTSASCTLEGNTIGEIDIDTTSGDTVMSSGSVSKIDFSSVSGDIEIHTTSMPAYVEGDTTSGDFKLYTPFSEDGFRTEFDSVSGDMNIRFIDGRKMSGSNLIVGQGKYTFEFDSVSGDCTVIET